VQQLSLTGQRHNDGKLRGGLRFTGFEQFREQQCNECDLAPSRGSAARLFFSCLACCTSQPNHRAEQDHWGCRGGQPKSAGSQPQRLLSRSGGGGTMVPHHSSTGSRTGSRPSFSPLFSITATSRSMEGTASRACALQHRHKHRHYSSMEGIGCRAGQGEEEEWRTPQEEEEEWRTPQGEEEEHSTAMIHAPQATVELLRCCLDFDTKKPFQANTYRTCDCQR